MIVKPPFHMTYGLARSLQSYALRNNCLGHWLGNEGGGTTLHDSTPSRRNGTIVGGVTFVDGRNGTSLLYNGSTGYIDLDAHVLAIAGLSTGTMAGWFKSSSSTANLTLLNIKGSGDTNFVRLMIGDSTGSYTDESLSFLVWRDGAEKIAAFTRDGHTAYLDDTWHHFAVVIDGITNSIYIDGVPKTITYRTGSGTTAEFSNVTSPANLRIGQLFIATPVYWPGYIDDVYIFGRALTHQEILSLIYEPYSLIIRAQIRLRNRNHVSVIPAPIEGTLNKALGILTAAATGELDLSAAAALTLDALTLAATGQTGTSGELGATLDDLTLAGTGALPIEGTAAPTLDDATVAGTGVLDLAASANITLDDLTSSATATLALVGNVAATLDAVTLLAAGVSEDRTGTLDVTLGDLTLSAYETIPEGGDGLDNILNITNNYGTLR